jgi:hypothetical protein
MFNVIGSSGSYSDMGEENVLVILDGLRKN